MTNCFHTLLSISTCAAPPRQQHTFGRTGRSGQSTAGRGLHSFPFQLNWSPCFHRKLNSTHDGVLKLLKLSSNLNECKLLAAGLLPSALGGGGGGGGGGFGRYAVAAVVGRSASDGLRTPPAVLDACFQTASATWSVGAIPTLRVPVAFGAFSVGRCRLT